MLLPSVTIAIPTWRRAELTQRAINSVLYQDYPGRIEVCVYIDGRDDETRSLMKRLDATLTFRSDLAANRAIRWEACDDNRGIAVAKNAALRLGTGALRGILDSDDRYEPGFVSACVAALDAHPEVVCVYTDNYYETPHRRVVHEAGDWSLETLLTCRLRGDTYLARTSALAKARLHDERFALELDYDLFFQLAALGPLLRIPRPLVTCTDYGDRTSQRDLRAVAYWHAACLAKHGQDKAWALRRAAQHPEWLSAIEDGYAQGARWREEAAHAPR